jgi:hypothetical protein
MTQQPNTPQNAHDANCFNVMEKNAAVSIRTRAHTHNALIIHQVTAETMLAVPSVIRFRNCEQVFF